MLEEDKERSERKFEAFLQPWRVASTVSNGPNSAIVHGQPLGAFKILR